MKKRLLRVSIVTLIFVIIGVLYGLFYIATGIGIPCTFYKITGLSCPGCGITRMCVALMQGDILSAIRSNAMLFFLTPLLLYIFGGYLLRYIRTGRWEVPRWQTIAMYIMIALLVLFGIVRNIIGI